MAMIFTATNASSPGDPGDGGCYPRSFWPLLSRSGPATLQGGSQSEGTYMTKAQDNITLIRRGFDAFNKGDVTTLKEVLTADCVQHMAGNNRFSGEHKGRDNILNMYGEIGALTDGTFQAVLNDV